MRPPSHHAGLIALPWYAAGPMSSFASAPLRAEHADAPAGPAGRFERMFDAHHDAIWRTLRRLGVPDAQVDDATQRVFIVAASKLGAIRIGEEGRFLYGVAVRIASEQRRRDPARREVYDESALASLGDDAPGPEERLLADEARHALDGVLAELSDDLRAVFVLVELEELTVGEVSTILGLAGGTAASRLRRAREEFTRAARRMRARLDHGGAR
jgi:RNA polymerase sigma-70 factor, ECF subfamily